MIIRAQAKSGSVSASFSLIATEDSTTIEGNAVVLGDVNVLGDNVKIDFPSKPSLTNLISTLQKIEKDFEK